MIPLPQLLPTIGTAERPLRPSGLDKLIKCGVWYTMMIGEDDEGGPAAQTGSVVHAAIAAFHTTTGAQEAVQAAVSALSTHGPKFPKSDPTEARLYLTPYLNDPRNQRARFAAIPQRDYIGVRNKPSDPEPKARVGEPAIEVPVRLILDPHPLDTTKQPIVIGGTLDQIRVDDDPDGYVDDIKTGQRTGYEMIHDYAYQQAAYVLAARQSGFPNAKPGRIIRVYGYRARSAKLPSPDGVFWHMPFDVAGAWALMDRVRLAVALVRNGYVEYGPGAWCTYCNFKGLDSCIPLANRKLFGT